MAVYAFAIVVRELSEEQALDVFDLDGSVGGGSTAGFPYVEFEIETDMPEGAIDAAIRALKDIGIDPVRIEMDLVNISAIAERTDMTRQAVRHWVEGMRGSEDFPKPFSVSNGQRLWLWADVYPWLVANEKPLADDYEITPLSTETLLCYNGHLADPHGPYKSPAEKRAATSEIPVLFATNLHSAFESFFNVRIEGPAAHVSSVVHWSEAVVRKAPSQRLDRRVRKTETPAANYKERAS